MQMRSHFAAQFFLLLNGDRIKQCTILRNQSANQVFALNSKKMIIPRMFCNAHEMCSIYVRVSVRPAVESGVRATNHIKSKLYISHKPKRE